MTGLCLKQRRFSFLRAGLEGCTALRQQRHFPQGKGNGGSAPSDPNNPSQVSTSRTSSPFGSTGRVSQDG